MLLRIAMGNDMDEVMWDTLGPLLLDKSNHLRTLLLLQNKIDMDKISFRSKLYHVVYHIKN